MGAKGWQRAGIGHAGIGAVVVFEPIIPTVAIGIGEDGAGLQEGFLQGGEAVEIGIETAILKGSSGF